MDGTKMFTEFHNKKKYFMSTHAISWEIAQNWNTLFLLSYNVKDILHSHYWTYRKANFQMNGIFCCVLQIRNGYWLWEAVAIADEM